MTTSDRSLPLVDNTSAIQMQALMQNCKEFGIKLYDMNNPNPGIVVRYRTRIGSNITWDYNRLW